MTAVIFYWLAYTIVTKYLIGINDDAGQIDVRLFIGSVASIVGILDGLVSWVTSRQWFSFVISPLLHALVTTAAWFLAKWLPWTRDASGFPTEWGFIGVASFLAILCGAAISDLKSKQ